MASLDANSRYVLMAENPTGNPVAIKVDNVTGYLLVSATVGSVGTPSPSTQSVDDNSRDVLSATNPGGATVIVQTDTNGNLYVTTA